MRLNESNWGRFERRKTIIIWSKTGRAIQIAATDVTDFFHFKLLSRFDEKIDAITNFLSTFLSFPFHLLDVFLFCAPFFCTNAMNYICCDATDAVF